MHFSLIDRLCARFQCKAEDLGPLISYSGNREEVENILKNIRHVAWIDGFKYEVFCAGLTEDPIGKIFCHVHGLSLVDEYQYNQGIMVKYKELPCVMSDDPDGRRYYFPMEIIDTLEVEEK